MIVDDFPENNLATEECGRQYKSSCKKSVFCGKDDTNLPAE